MSDIGDKFKAQVGSPEDTMKAYGWDQAGISRLQKTIAVPQEYLFNKTADLSGAERGQDANATAGNVVSKLTEGLGHSTAADVLRAALQTGATVGLDPTNFVAPGVGKEKMLGGIVQDAAKAAEVKGLAKHVLETKDIGLLNQIRQESAKGAAVIAPRSTPGGLDVIKGNVVPTNARGVKIISGANELANPAIKRQNLNAVSLRPPEETMIAKVSDSVAKNQPIGFSKAVSPQDQARAMQAIEILKGRLK